jgi:hypothetical protein
MIITEEYREQNRLLHETNPHYGISGSKWREFARDMSDWGRKPILDFGAGKCTLAKSLGPAYRVTNYDPCIPELNNEPEPHPVVVCGDVMEHVEPDLVDSVLNTIRGLCMAKALFVVALGPSSKTLADGRNSHISQHPAEWWHERLEANGFKITESKPMDKTGYTVWFICE